MTNDFQEFYFVENGSNATNSDYEVCNDLEKVNICSEGSNAQKIKNSLMQTLEAYEQIETEHQEEIQSLKIKVKNIEQEKNDFKSQCEILEQEKNKYWIELQSMKDSMKQLIYNFNV